MPSAIPVEISIYDPDWPHQFELEKAVLLNAIRPYITAVEHVGSTAVPGLAAKPVIDILIGIHRLKDASFVIPPLQGLGYTYIPSLEVDIPERRYLQRIIENRHTHHLHIVEPGTAFYKDHLLFRDYLRSHPEDAAQYAQLKRDLAASFYHDRESYTDGKAGFIQAILQKARG
jgi:GrpB-like predicted nucleotidyltransferase (UPF0157 family)